MPIKSPDPSRISSEPFSNLPPNNRWWIFLVLGFLAALFPLAYDLHSNVTANYPASPKANFKPISLTPESSLTGSSYLPLIFNQSETLPLANTYRVNLPFFNGDVQFTETGILWFGKVNSTDNYVDVRLGYTDQELYIRLAAFDRRLWYDTTPAPGELTSWDAASLYLDLDGNTGKIPDANDYQFVGQLNWSEPRTGYQAAYQGDGSGWMATPVPFTTISRYWGDAPNNDEDDRGWSLTYRIPLTSLGLDRPPPDGRIWGMAVTLHDRDDAAGTLIPAKSWPPAMSPGEPETWGQLAFGLPAYSTPIVTPSGTTVIRHELNGAIVADGMVGGSSICGTGLDFWTEWGEANYAGASQVNIQNQFAVADWPCFSKFYITFPLDAIPPAAEIISANLTLYQFGNAGGGNYGDPTASLVQVFTIADAWDENRLNWNNAPLASENVSRAWVEPITSPISYPGAPRTWDVSKAVADAHMESQTLRLVLYSADGDYNSGKYFYSSDIGDWNAEGRPTLKVVWGYP